MTLIDWIALGVMLLGVILLIVRGVCAGGLVCRAWLVCCFARQDCDVCRYLGASCRRVHHHCCHRGGCVWIYLVFCLKGRLSRSKLILNDAVTEKAGYADFDALGDWVGKQGVAISPLRPAGVVEIEGETAGCCDPRRISGRGRICPHRTSAGTADYRVPNI